MVEQNSLHSEYDAIGEALEDAICNGEGRPTAKHLLIELAHRGLRIVTTEPTDAARGRALPYLADYPGAFAVVLASQIYRAMVNEPRIPTA